MQVTHDLGIGGLPRVVVTLARTIDRERFDVSVLCMNTAGELARDLEEEGVPVLTVPSPRHPDYLAALRVFRILRRSRIDVLHTHNTQPFLEAGFASLLAGVRTLVHTDHGRGWPDLRRYVWGERVMSGFAYRVVGVSKETSAQLIEFGKIDPKKVVTIRNGIDPRPFDLAADRSHLRRELGISERVPVICTVARFEREKGVDVLIGALPTIVRAMPDLICLIVGYGEQEDELKASVRSHGVQARVQFLGPRRDVADILMAADCYVLPSRREGLPMTILEAMAASRPVVATRVGGIPGAVTDGRTGLLVEPESPAALASAVLQLFAEPARLQAYGVEARKRFDADFSANAMTREYENLYLRGASARDTRREGVESRSGGGKE
jgi:sugar transferase (PEP-CTERM/EpsH1 system associated)